MAIHRLKRDRDVQWSVTTDDDTWIVGAARRIDVENQHGISENGHSGSRIVIDGLVRTEGVGYAGVLVESSDSRVTVGRGGVIDAAGADAAVRSEAAGADAAVRSEAAGAEIVNRGLLAGGSHAIAGTIWGSVVNYGTMRGYDGIDFDGAGTTIENHGKLEVYGTAVWTMSADFGLVNAKGGLIENQAAACIYLEGAGEATIINRGRIQADSGTAIACAGDLTLVNRGEVFGNIHMSSSDDLADLRRGDIDGEIRGGKGDDVFRISSADISIVEYAAEGVDSVYSSVSITLAANIERLYLVGKQDLYATGNLDDNYLTGNAGDNRLRGEAGYDILIGQGGNDQLFGGAGADVFGFDSGFGRDVIRDFEDGGDHIAAAAIQSESDFNVAKFLYMDQVGSDVVMNFGAGDRLVIRNLALADLTFADFV